MTGNTAASSREDARMVKILREHGYVVEKIIGPGNISERNAYRPYVNPWATYLPWVGNDRVLGLHRELKDKDGCSLVGSDRMWTLGTLLKQAFPLGGEVWEMGVYKGGSALFLKKELTRMALQGAVPRLRLFDSFSGMPKVEQALDCHREGDFGDTSLEAVKSVVGNDPYIRYHKGIIPETFIGLEESRISLAHIDVDIHKSVKACCEFVYFRMLPGGFMVFDDYGIHTCPGARRAVDGFFKDKPESPLVLTTGQAVVFKALQTV